MFFAAKLTEGFQLHKRTIAVSFIDHTGKMSHNEEDFQKWIERSMSRITDSLGPHISDVKYELPNPSRKTIMSSRYNIDVSFQDETKGERVKLSLILKTLMQSDFLKTILHGESQFHNESLFYQKYAQPGENIPRCLYVGQSTNPLIVLENMNTKGYHSCSYTYDVPLEYTLAVMRELGRFHAKGYYMKEHRREELFALIDQLQEVRYYENKINLLRQFANIFSDQSVKYLRRQGYDPVFCDKMDVLFAHAYTDVVMKLIQPLEPLSTLCHGDLTIDNVLFKMDSDGKYRAMFLDFALIRYATPVVDLSTYLCICCSTDVRRDKFPEIMRAYHDALKEYLQDAGIWDADKYSYDAFLENYRWGSLFGFILASSYLLILTGHMTIDPEKMSMGTMEYLESHKPLISDDISKKLADMLLELKDFGCLEHFL